MFQLTVSAKIFVAWGLIKVARRRPRRTCSLRFKSRSGYKGAFSVSTDTGGYTVSGEREE